jgi:hypothetical protein
MFCLILRRPVSLLGPATYMKRYGAFNALDAGEITSISTEVQMGSNAVYCSISNFINHC